MIGGTMKVNKNLDRRIVIVYVFCIGFILLGITYALTSPDIGITVATGNIGIDETGYGSTSFDSSNLKMYPILDENVDALLTGGDTSVANNVILITFNVRGSSTNPTDRTIIYDISLADLSVADELLSRYVKWKLVKNDTAISSGSLSTDFDTITDGRLVLTNIQQDLKAYSETADEYKFVMWISDSCQESDITKCIDTENQDDLLNKTLAGKIEIDMYTGSKKALVRNPS